MVDARTLREAQLRSYALREAACGRGEGGAGSAPGLRRWRRQRRRWRRRRQKKSTPRARQARGTGAAATSGGRSSPSTGPAPAPRRKGGRACSWQSFLGPVNLRRRQRETPSTFVREAKTELVRSLSSSESESSSLSSGIAGGRRRACGCAPSVTKKKCSSGPQCREPSETSGS